MIYIALLKKHRLNSKPGEGEKVFENFYKIDNTNISAEDVAKMIKEKFNLQKEVIIYEIF